MQIPNSKNTGCRPNGTNVVCNKKTAHDSGLRKYLITAILTWQRRFNKLDKVIIPKEVAEAIETLRKQGFTDFYIIGGAYANNADDKEIQVIRGYILSNSDELCDEREKGYATIMQALVNGWKVEKSPEDIAREMYNNSESALYRCGLIDGLMIFGHKVKGVTPDA